MFDKIEQLLITIAGRICKIESIECFKKNTLRGEDLLESPHLINVESVILNTETNSCMKDLSKKETLLFLTNVKNHYKVAARHIMSKSSLQAYPHSSLLTTSDAYNLQEFRIRTVSLL